MIKVAKYKGDPEIFLSFQGEGKNLGRPSIFIRLSLCNLYCIWCDTDYTWNWKGTDYKHIKDNDPNYEKFEKDDCIIKVSADDIMSIVRTLDCKNIVITGGEPLVQHKQLIELFKSLKSEGYHIEIETNGTIIPNDNLDVLSDQYNVSIKLSNAHVKKEDRIIPDAINYFANSEKSNFKFVVDNMVDLQEIEALIVEYSLDKELVYLMPQGTTSEMILEKSKWLEEVCKNKGYHFTTRKHVELYGDKRGV